MSEAAPAPNIERRDGWDALLAWYDAEKRDLPWRRTRDPYRILVAEVMLQQTQVKTVLGYYERFLERFPDLRSLASAGEEEVLAAWKGLGYYRRARNLHACAKQALAEYGGELPRSYRALRRLKGIGEYTAAAVASIAFGEPKGAVDGNVLRVMARYLGIEEPVDGAKARRAIQRAVDQAISTDRPGDFNQALMELGARICTPQRPKCGACPLKAGCRALSLSMVDQLPKKARRERVLFSRRVVGVVEKCGRILLVRRPADGLLGGMWEFVNVEASHEPGAGDAELLRERVRRLTGDEVEECSYLGRVTHRFSHLLWQIDAYRLKARPAWPCGVREPVSPLEVAWRPAEEVDQVALPKAMQKVWALGRLP